MTSNQLESVTAEGDNLDGAELHVLRCEACGTATYRQRLRCANCGAEQLAPDLVSGLGTVYAVTSTSEHTFLVVAVTEGLRVLAISRAARQWRIDEPVLLCSGADPLPVAEPVDAGEM
jgi:hypothetical protein